MITPGFLENGIDFEQLVYYYLDNNCNIEITDPAELNLVNSLMERVINGSRGYTTGALSTVHGRFQYIFNSTLQELHIQQKAAEKLGLVKRSSAVWLLNSVCEYGTDFISKNGKNIEAKMYKNYESMIDYAKNGSFHGADYVLCYLIYDCCKHWYWLKRNNGEYTEYNDIELSGMTSELLKNLPICSCTFVDNKFIISKK